MKFIQICASACCDDENVYERLYALGDDGNVFEYDFDEKQWVLLGGFEVGELEPPDEDD